MKIAPNEPRNVLMVNTFQTGGGAGRVAQTLAERLRHAGLGVEAFVKGNPADDPCCHRVSHWRVAAIEEWLQAHGLPELGDLTSFAWRCRAEYATADILHLHNLHGAYLSLAALPLWGWDKPIVWTLHDHWPLTGNCATPRDCGRWQHACGHCPLLGVYPMSRIDRSRFYRWLKPRLFAAARPRIVTPSEWLAARVRRVPQLRHLPITVIRNPIDTEVFAPRDGQRALREQFALKPDHPTIVMAGANWGDRFKGANHALQALRVARAKVPTLQLLAIGGQSNGLLAASGLPGRALPFLEGRTSLAEAYSAADLCLFPSRAENYPATTLEALACETPVVAYSVGGIPEQVRHDVCGYVARDGRPDELAAGIIALATHPEHARRMGRHGREFVLRTSALDVTTRRYREEYRRAFRDWCRRRDRNTPRIRSGRVARCVAEFLGWPSIGPTRAPSLNTSRFVPDMDQRATMTTLRATPPTCECGLTPQRRRPGESTTGPARPPCSCDPTHAAVRDAGSGGDR